MSRVCLVISSFRHDEAVAGILRSVQAMDESLFSSIIIVDSLATGVIPALMAEHGWNNVHYHSHARNLGSAGNLAERLRLAAATNADFAYAINHDGPVDPEAVRLLLEYTSRFERIGAVYPLRLKPNRERYDLTGAQSLPLPFRGQQEQPSEEYIDVHWSSSNGALYALQPIREGLAPWADLWMGWEDMGYGWMLERHGYRQIVVTRAHFVDDAEYRRYKFLGHTLFLTDKPAWYAYYHVRNLLLIARRNRAPISFHLIIAARILLELGLTTAFRPDKLRRYSLLLRGLSDGLRNKSGKAQWPADKLF